MAFFDPSAILLVLLMLLGGGVRNLASCISTADYWRAKGVSISVDGMIHELTPLQAADVSRLIAGLEADDARDRDAATERIASLGPAMLPSLESAAKDGPPEVAARARFLIAKFHAAPKATAIRRLMAIRTLGQLKDRKALDMLQSLTESKEPFEADYAKAAIAAIDGKELLAPSASDADRAADVALLPARLDVVAQLAPLLDREFSFESLLDQVPMDAESKVKQRESATAEMVKILDAVGNVRLDALTWGFYAAPTGVPGNSMVIARAQFDFDAVCNALTASAASTKKMDGINVFTLNDDSAVLVSPDGRVVFLVREPGGELALETMVAALKKGAGDLDTNADLTKLVKAVDAKAPFWAVGKISPGLRDIIGPLGEFDTATAVGQQSLDAKHHVVTQLTLEATTPDAAKAAKAASSARDLLAQAVAKGRQEEQLLPFLKPAVDFIAGVQVDVEGGKAKASASMTGFPLLPLTLGAGAQFVPGQR